MTRVGSASALPLAISPPARGRPTQNRLLEQLGARVQGGDRAAFADLVVLTSPRLQALARRVSSSADDPQDILQDAFLKAWRSRDRLRDPARVVSWLGRIVRNVAIDRARRRRSTPVRHDEHRDGAGDVDAGAPDASHLAQQRQLQRMATTALMELPERYRTVLLLRVADELTNREIAELLGCPVGTVESRLVRGRRAAAKTMRRLLEAAPR